MLLLDDNTPSLMAVAAAQGGTPPIPEDEFVQGIKATDSIRSTLADSLKNMSVTDLKDVVTGQNTLIKDALRELTQLTVGFIPKLLVAILILWVGLKLAKLLKKGIIRSLDRRGAEASLKTFLASLVDLLLKAMIIIMAMDVIGIKATSFIALLGALGPRTAGLTDLAICHSLSLAATKMEELTQQYKTFSNCLHKGPQ